jgi:hypothetical protein
MPQPVNRLSVVFLLLGGTLIGARDFLVPKTFGVFMASLLPVAPFILLFTVYFRENTAVWKEAAAPSSS